MHFVYKLVDPRNNVTYIGITSDPNQRYNEHLEGREGKGKKYEWISRLLEEGIQPKMQILEIVDDLKQARRQERYWIQNYLDQGIALVNTRLVDSTIKEEKQISEAQPPYGYITGTEASRRLNVSNSMINHYARQGLIGYLLPPGRKHGFYLEKDVDDLVKAWFR